MNPVCPTCHQVNVGRFVSLGDFEPALDGICTCDRCGEPFRRIGTEYVKLEPAELDLLTFDQRFFLEFARRATLEATNLVLKREAKMGAPCLQ